MTSNNSPEAQLRAENAELRARLEEAEEALRTIRSGEVEALVVETADGPQIFALQGLDAESNRFPGEILAQVSDSVIAVDADQRVTYLNAAAERQYRVSASDALGRQLSEIYTRRWPHAEAEGAMWAALREHGEWRGEIIHHMHDGREIARETSVTALRDASGAATGYVAVFRDITEHKRAEEMLRKSEERYRRLIETAHEGIWAIDAQGCTTYVNQRLADLLGYTPAEIMGRVHTDFMWEEDRPKGEVDLELRRQGIPQVWDQRYRRKDDSELWTVASCNAMFDPDGTFIGALGMFTDITERKRSAAEIQRLSALLESLLHTARIGFCFLDRDLRYTRINERLAEMNGISAEAHVGRHFCEVVPTLAESVREVTGRILATGKAVLNHEFSGETPADPGVTRFWSESWYPVRDAAGEILSFGVIVEEITERKEAEEQLRAAHDSFRHLVEHSPFGIYAVDADFRLVQVSAGAQKVFENVRPLLGRDFAEVFRIVWSEPFAGEAIAIFHRVLESGEPYYAPSLVEQRQDIAAVETYDWKVERLTLPDGRLGVVCHFYDLSERQRFEDALRESQQFTHRVLDNLFAFVGVTTADGTLIEVNRAPMEAAGIPASEVLGKKFWDCYWWSYSPEIQAQLRDACERAAGGEVVRYDVPVRMAGDTRVWIDFQVAALRDTEGRITHLIPSAMDIAVRRATEEKLRESEGRFRALATASSQVVYEMSPDWGEMRKLDGRSFLGSVSAGSRTWLRDYNHPEDQPKIMARVHESIRTKSIFELEHRVRRVDGTWGWTFSRAVPMLDAKGEIIEWFGTASDVTARKEAEAALRQSEERFRAAVGEVSDIIWTNNAQGKMEGEQPGWGAFTGQRQEEYQGYGWSKAVHPEDAQPTLDAWNLAVAEKRMFEFEHRVRRHDGEWRLCSIRAVPVLDPTGGIREWVGVHTDITERELAAKMNESLLLSSLRHQEKLRESEAKFRQIADTMPQIAWAARPDGYIDYYNERWYEFTGVSRHEFGQSSWEPMLHPDDVQRCVDTYFGCIRSGKPYRIEYRFQDRASGGYRWFLGQALPVRDERGEITRWFGTCTEIDDQKRAEEKLEATVAERTAKLQETIAELESYSYSISHDMRAPLRAMQSFAQILEEECRGQIGTQGREYIRRIVTAADRMDRLIQDVLVYSRVARTDITLENVDLAALLNGILEGYPQFQSPKAEITVAFPLPPVRGNVAALTQCLSNLIGNAVKFVPPGVVPHVKISAVTRDNRVRLSIQDNGIGIDPKMHEKIFGVFNRLSRDYEGTGIGLAVVRRAAERMGGAILVESELGKGSTFHLELNGASWE